MPSVRTPEVSPVSLTFAPVSTRARRAFAFVASALALAIGFSGLSALTTLESAAAAGSNPLGALKGFTVVTQGDATFGNSGEIEGSLAVGGNLAFQQYNLAPNQDGSALPTVDGQSNVGLFVGGTVTFPGSGKFDINGGGIARITGTTGLSVSADQRLYAGSNQQAYVKSQAGSQTTVASYTATAGSYATAFPSSTFSTLASTSSAYAAVTSTGGDYAVVGPLGNPGGEPILTLTAGKVNVWNVSSTVLAGKTAFQFANGVTPSSTTPLIINVTDASGGTMNAVRVGDKTTAPYVLWNFSGWSALEITGSAQLNGSILAPSAAVKNSNGSETNGQIVAKSFVSNTGAEIHHYGFAYTTPEKTVVAGSWTTTTECASPSNQLLVNAVTGVTYTWTSGATGDFTSYAKSGLTGTYAFTVAVTDPSKYTLGTNPTTFSVTFTSPKDCAPPTSECIPSKFVTYTYDQATNSGTVVVADPRGYNGVLCKPFWVTAVAWKFTKNAVWPQALDVENPMSNNEGGYVISKPGTYTYGAPVACGQGDIYASYVSQEQTSPTGQGKSVLNGPSTPFTEYFLHGMAGFVGPTPTYVQSPLGCNKVTPVPATATSSTQCDVPGAVTVGPAGSTVVLTTASPIAKIGGVVYTLTAGNGTAGAWEVTATPDTYKYFDGSQKVVYSGDLGSTSECAVAVEPKLTDAVCAPNTGVVTNAYVVIPSGTHFTYMKNGSTLAAGQKVELLPSTTTVIAVVAKPGYTNTGATSFTFTQGAIDCDKPVEYVTPKLVDQTCVVATGEITGATVEFRATAHVTYLLDGAPVVIPAGQKSLTVPVAAGTHVVTVQAEKGYFLDGTKNLTSTTIPYEVTAPATCDKPVEYVAPSVTDEICTKATGDVSGAFLTFEKQAHLTYFVDGVAVVFPAGAVTVDVPVTPGTRVVTATAGIGYFIQGTTAASKDYDVVVAKADTCDKPVEYVAPKVETETCDVVDGGTEDGTVTFAKIPAHLSYVFNGSAVKEGDVVTLPAGDYDLVVIADAGWFITGADGEETYTVTVTGPGVDCDEPVEYVAPAVTDQVCVVATGELKGAFLTFTATDDLTYFVDGAAVVFPAGATTVAVPVTPGTRVVTATAGTGYFIAGTSLTTKDYDVVVAAAGTCDKPVEYVAPKVEQESCDAVEGGSAEGSVTFATIPAHLTYVFNGSPVAAGDSFALSAGDYQLVVTAAPGYVITGADAEETYTITVAVPADDCDELTTIPTDPFASPQECVEIPVDGEPELTDGAITIVYAQHVTWSISSDADGVRHPVTVTQAGNVAGHPGWNTFAYPAGSYHVWATADAGHFLHTTPASTVAVTEVSFASVVHKPEFDCQLPDYADLPAEASWTNQVCTAAGIADPTITIVPSAGVTYFLDGVAITQTVTTVEPGTYVLTAEADDPANTVSQTWAPLVLTAASAALCGDLTTLALTGETPAGWLILAIVLLQAGLVLMAVRFIRSRRQARHLAV